MNRIYKTVWNEQAQTFVAVSEIACARGKRCGVTAGSGNALVRLLRNLALGSLTLAGASTLGASIPALADTVAGANIEVTQSGNDAIVSTVESPRFGNITINDAGSGRITGVADGTADTDAVNLRQLLSVSQVANSGWNIQSNGDTATNVAPGATVQLKNGQNVAITRNGTDITIASVTSPKFGSVTVNDAGSGRITGVANGTGTNDAVNLGQLNRVGGKTDALGSSSAANLGGGASYDSQTGQVSQPSYTVNNANGTTTTVHNVGDALKGISVGGIKYFHANSTLDDSKAGGTDAIAIGPESQAEGDDGFAAGHGASINENTNSGIAIGKAAAIGQLSDSAMAIGDAANVGDSAANAIAIGTQAGVGKNGVDAVAVGHSATADQDAVSIGHSAMANTGAVGLGMNARASGGSSVAIGNGAQGSMGGDVAIGSGAGSGSAGTASIDTDNVYLGTQAGAGVANGGHNVAIGFKAGSGRGNDSDENIAIGTEAGSGQTGRGNISIGIGAASGSNTSNESTTIGYNANASQSYAVAVGSNASANGANATAFGYNSMAAGSNSLALGAGAQAKYGGSIALGSGSIADQTLDHQADPAFLTGQQANYTLSVGAAPSGGNPGIVRRISNVAGGSLDNDAVNVAQLKNLEQGVQDVIGAYASVNPATGQLQYKRPDGQGGAYNTLDDYLDALSTGSGIPQPAPAGAVMYDSGPNHGRITLDGNGSGGGTRISNVADGIDAGDAVNKGQLDSTINANKTHYFSVNSTDAANRDNAGATGADAIAVGLGAESVGDHSLALGPNAKAGSTPANESAIAIGNNADTREAYGLSLGAEARATGQYASAIGYGARSDGNGSIALGKNASAEQQNGTPAPDDAVAIGTSAHVTRDQGTAIGRGATVQAQGGQALGDGAQVLANNAVALGTGATADATNAHAQGTHAYAHGADSLASGTGAATYSSNSMALGNGAVSGDANLPTGSTSSDSIAMGTTANVIGDHSIAIGSGNTVGVHGQQPGGSEKLIGNFSGAFGNNNTIAQDNTFVLGNAVTATQANSVVLGNASTDRAATTETGVTINGTKYSFAGPGSAADGVVSIGAQGKERQLINVAAGKVSADSTDAINGSQLYSVQDTAQKPITFTGNSGTTPVQLGHTLAIKGASSTGGTYSGANIKTVINNGAVNIQLADAPVFAGMVTAQGFNASGKKITNVAPGTDGTDAVNVSQLGAATAAVKTHYYSVNDGGTQGDNYANDGATGVKSLAAGVNASAAGANSVAVGDATVSGESSIGIAGYGGDVDGDHSVGIGSNTDMEANDAVGIGYNTQVSVDGNVALGANSIANDTQHTGSYAINGATVAGLQDGSAKVVSVGAANNERQIQNVAPGVLSSASTDAINGSQLYATNQAVDNLNTTITKGLTHYYSVNDGGTQGSNYNNDGATGTNALAAGVGAQASGNGSMAIGQNANADQTNGIAIGTNAVATGDATNGTGGAPMAIGLDALADGYEATAVGYKSKAVGNSTTALGVTATATQYNALAVGNYTFASGWNSAALGSNATASNTNATAVGNGATASGANATALGSGAPFTTQGPVASGNNSVAIGYGAKATNESAIAMGNGAQATGGNSISIGTGNVASGANSGTFGNLSTVAGTGSYSVGNNNTIAKENTFVMGNDVTATQANSVVLGNASTDHAATTVAGDTINGTHYTYAGQGSAANGVVSVGSAGAERQIINVAAGRVSADSTDAVNGSQLYATNQAIDDVSQVANAGWNLSANGGNTVNIKPGATLDVSQGDNIVVTQDAATGNLRIATSMTPSFTSVTTGNTIMSNDGIVISGGANGTVSLGNSGLDNGGNKIINVAPGEISANSTDAVNGGQIHKLTDVLSLEYDQNGDKYFINYDGNKYTSLAAALDSMHWNVDVPGQGGSSGTGTGSQSGSSGSSGSDTGGSSNGSGSTEIHNGDTVGIVAGNNITVSKSERPDNDGANVTIGLSNDITVNSVTTNTVNADQVEIKNGPTINQNGIDMHDKRITNLAPGVDGSDAVNVNQLNDLADRAAHDINRVNGRVTENDHRASAGIAAAIATAGLPQAYLPGKSMFSIAGGTWRGESGYAMGLSTVSDNGQWVIKGTASGSSRGDFGGSVGVGYQW